MESCGSTGAKPGDNSSEIRAHRLSAFHKFVKMQKRPANTLPEIDKFDKGNRPKMVPVKSIYLKLAV